MTPQKQAGCTGKVPPGNTKRTKDPTCKGFQCLTINRVSNLLSISRSGVYRLIADSELQGLKVRGSMRITAASLEGFLNRQKTRFEIENGITPREKNRLRISQDVSG